MIGIPRRVENRESRGCRVVPVPGAVASTSTWERAGGTLPYVAALADKGVRWEIGDDPMPVPVPVNAHGVRHDPLARL